VRETPLRFRAAAVQTHDLQFRDSFE
jgi:hypothetical protein